MLSKADFKVRQNRCAICGEGDSVLVARGTDFEYGTTDMMFNFYRCKECSLIFIDPIPDETMLDVIYPPDYYAYRTHRYNKFIATMRARQLDTKVKKFLGKSGKAGQKDLRVLEIGCGKGNLLMALQRHDSSMRLMGIDFSNESIEYIRSIGFSGQSGNIADMDLGNGQFDLIICQQLLEHLHNPLSFLKRVRSWLDDDGVLILETPGIDTIDRSMFRSYWGGYHIPRHFFLFGEKAIARIMGECRFTIRDIFYDPCFAFWLWSVHNVILKFTRLKGCASFFSLSNPIALFPFWVIENLRCQFMKTASMGVICNPV